MKTLDNTNREFLVAVREWVGSGQGRPKI